MTHSRHASTVSGSPHAIGLRVLRLSRPSLATQTALPNTKFDHGLDIPAAASQAYAAGEESNAACAGFPLTPLLTLPAGFGAAYVGETFVCTLCANCENAGEGGPAAGGASSVSDVRIEAELQGVPLELHVPDNEKENESGAMAPGTTLQRTLRHELTAEGAHDLVVTVSYTETPVEGKVGVARARTFKKLYQFVAQRLIEVRSKVTERRSKASKSGSGRAWVLEAQVENVGEVAVVVKDIWLGEKEGIRSRWIGGEVGGEKNGETMVLQPQMVEQVMFELAEEKVGSHQGEGMGREPLARLNVEWASPLGEKGHLTTGWLTSRGR